MITFGNTKIRRNQQLNNASRVSWEGFSTTSIRDNVNQRSIPTGVNYTHLQQVLKMRSKEKIANYHESALRVRLD